MLSIFIKSQLFHIVYTSVNYSILMLLSLVGLQCIVQSYLQWLQDSDYNPNCTLCNNPLTAQDTVRLVCYGKSINSSRNST